MDYQLLQAALGEAADVVRQGGGQQEVENLWHAWAKALCEAADRLHDVERGADAMWSAKYALGMTSAAPKAPRPDGAMD